VLALLTLAGFLDFWELGQNGYANDYYSAAVRSMAHSWHDFAFVSFDPGGLVTVDKPPLALWTMVASARVFGYSPWSLLWPEAAAGVAAVALLYLLVARSFGRIAGLVAGLALAVSPASVAVNRDNGPDALLALLLVGAAYTGVRAVENGSLGWLLATGALVGLAFETKMLLALAVVPGCALAYLLLAPGPWRTRIVRLAAAGALAAVVAGAWIAAVELTPSGDRPYVGSTSDNSALTLAFDYNGLGRVRGQLGGTLLSGVGSTFAGKTGVLRLLDKELGEQGAWLLPLAIAGGAVALAVALRLRDRRRLACLAILGCWFVGAAAAFSFSHGVVHTYYLSTLAPATAGLVGAGVGSFPRGRWQLALLAAGLLAAASVEVFLVRRSHYLTWLEVLVPVGVGVALAAAFAPWRGRVLAVAAAALVLLIAPAAWAETALEWPGNGIFPGVGPSFVPGLARGDGFAPLNGYPPPRGQPLFPNNVAETALAYAKGHGATNRFSLVVSSVFPTALLIEKGERASALGGFAATEKVLTPAFLSKLVRGSEARYFLLGGVFPGTVTTGTDLITSACRSVPDAAWSPYFAGGMSLWDCGGRAAEIAARSTKTP
jgi:4-amino-4-deoxy-L-arabinose transferase-like glycosyltransferase